MSKSERNKLNDVISALSRIELKHISFYIHSDIHGFPGEISVIYEELHKRALKNEPLPDNQDLLRFLQLQGNYSLQDIRLFKTYILRCIEKVLVIKELEINEGYGDVLLFSAYNKRNLHTNIDQNYQALLQKHDGQTLRDARYYQNAYLLEEEHYKSRLNVGRKNYDFERMVKSLDTYYLSEKFRIASLHQTYKTILGTGYSDTLLSILIDFVEQTPEVLNDICIAAYYYSYQCSRFPEELAWFEKLFNLIENDQLTVFRKDEQRDLILFANNFCIRRINKGEALYLEKSFHLYQKGIQSGALLEKGHLSRFTYKNIVTLGIRLHQYEWTEQFIEDTKSLLEFRYQQSSYCYNKATLVHALGKFEEAIGLLSQASQDDYFIYLASKNLLLKIYYELGYYDALESLLGSITIYIKRKQLEKIYQDNYHNIIAATRKLLQLKHLTNSQRKTLDNRKEKVKKIIIESNPLTEKKWLLEKLAEV